MLELNKWFFVQLANFLLLMIVLNIILFRPILQFFKERERHTTGYLDDAKKMGVEKDELLKQIDAKISHARNNARNIFEELANEGVEIQKGTIESAQNEASEMNRKAREELSRAADEAKKSLKTEVQSFSRQIVEKLAKV